MGKAVSIKKRWEIIFLHTHYLGPKLSKSVISKRLRVTPRVIDHWIKIYNETGDVQEKKKSGRKKNYWLERRWDDKIFLNQQSRSV
jgi:transposase